MTSSSPKRRLVIAVLAVTAGFLLFFVAGWILYPLWQERQATPVSNFQPDRIDFGTVYSGATVEGSVRVFFDRESAGLKPRVRGPRFLKVADIVVDTHSNSRTGDSVTCDIFFTIKPIVAGDRSVSLKVLLGDEIAEIPVRLTVLPRSAETTKVLVTASPFKYTSTHDVSHFEPLLNLTRSAQLDLHYTRHLPLDLSGFDVLLLAGKELCQVDEEKISRIKDFVAAGGRLVICANAFLRPSVPKANEVLKHFGLQMQDIEPIRQVDVATIEADGLTEGIRKLTWFRPSPVQVIDPRRGKILVPSPGDPRNGNAYVAVARDKEAWGNGEVIVLGQSLWWFWIGRGSDNARLLKNLLTRGGSDRP